MPRFTLAPQLLNNSAEVLAGGKLYFYETGTTTLKTTYSDSAESTANTNPVILDSSGRVPDIFFTGTARVIIKTSDDVQLDDIDPWIPTGALGSTIPIGDWSASTTYAINELVTGSDDKVYRSIAGSNLNNNPASTSGYWSEVNLIYLYDAVRTYSQNEICLSGDILYRSIAGSNQGNTPASSPAQWRAISTDDFNGSAAVYLDADRDTYLKLNTDDVIDVYIASALDFSFQANVFEAKAGSVIKADTINETTSAAGVTIDGVLLKDNQVVLSSGNITDHVYTITDGGSVDINPANGLVQVWELGANRTPTASSFANGQKVELYINDGAGYDVTWTTIGVTWLNNGGVKPNLATAGYTCVVLRKFGGVVYGFVGGNQT